jgi:hypothetical protein
MIRFVKFLRRAAVAATLALLALAPAAAQVAPAGVSLRISHEAAPPGTFAQMKVFVTEVQPITTAFAAVDVPSLSEIQDLALGASDTAGMAVVRGSRIAMSVVSPSGTFGMDPDAPVLTFAVRVPVGAPLGTRFPVTIDPGALRFVDPAGVIYPTEVKDGSLLSATRISITDVTGASLDPPAGSIVSVYGTGFRSDTRVRLKETALAQVIFVNPGRMDAILAQPAHLHGLRVRARNRDGVEATYFAHRRSRRSGVPLDPLLRDVFPVFPAKSVIRASLRVAPGTVGIAVQNPGSIATMVFAELVDVTGRAIAAGQILVAGNAHVVRGLAEIFGFAYRGSGLVRFLSVTPVQVLGVEVDPAGVVAPRLPQ